MTIELTISGMSCGGCAASLQKALLAELIALIEAKGFSAK